MASQRKTQPPIATISKTVARRGLLEVAARV
jgi:hypothetical protein